ncbi:terminase small subunit [Flavobacterium sp.]|uniref:terminase small subunit n=1 Tax=Flavobacterium sp. TaxID=239 RepID=UPI0037515DB2
MALTEKQEAFCQAYIELGDKSKAYRHAYDADSMNSNSVAVAGNEAFKNPNVSLRIEELQNEIRERNKVKIDDVLSVLADMIRFDISELYDENDNLKSIHDIPKSHRQMISSLKTDHLYGGKEIIGETKEVKTLNKLDVIEKFMKHLGAYEKDNGQKQTNITVSPLMPDEIKKINDSLESTY